MKALKLALRSIFHFRLYSLINIIGLALALACVIVIFRYVYGEITVDRFHSKLDRLYITYVESSDNDYCHFTAVSNPNRDQTFIDLRKSPAIELWSNFHIRDDAKLIVNEHIYASRIIAADRNFLQILDYPVISGVIDLKQPHSCAINADYAQRIFGKEDPLGKTVILDKGQRLTITGVIGSPSSKSSLEFDFLFSSYLTDYWHHASVYSVILLHPNQDYRKVNQEYSNWFKASQYNNREIHHQLFPYKNIYLNDTHITSYHFLQGNKNNIILLSSVGFLILLIGVFNFINIYLAVSRRRGRELGMKKVFGAGSGQIFLQLYIENLALIALALLLALSFTEICSPLIKNRLGLQQLPFIGFDFFLSGILLVTIPLITSLFPYIRYRYSTPITSLHSVGKTGGRGFSRQLFLLFQYTITLFIIILALFFNKQLHAMLHADPGFRTEGIMHSQPFITPKIDGIIYDEEAWEKEREREKALSVEIVQQIAESPLFTRWAFGESPIRKYMSSTEFSFQGNDNKGVNIQYATKEWLKLFEVELLDGRLFNEQDLWGDYKLIASESLLKYYGITHWQDALLQPKNRLWYSSLVPQEEMEKNPPYEIIGIVKTFNGGHLGHRVVPTVFLCDAFDSPETLSADFFGLIAPGKTQEAIAFLQKLCEKTGSEFKYTFIEDELAALYDEDRKVAQVYTIFALIAILISTLGLFSISLFDIEQRYNEIAIRKVNGATTGEIILLLLKKYVILLSIAFGIATPLAWLTIMRYLEDFAFKTPLSWWIFVLALFITAVVSLLTLILQSRKAAETNPARVIRNE